MGLDIVQTFLDFVTPTATPELFNTTFTKKGANKAKERRKTLGSCRNKMPEKFHFEYIILKMKFFWQIFIFRITSEVAQVTKTYFSLSKTLISPFFQLRLFRNNIIMNDNKRNLFSVHSSPTKSACTHPVCWWYVYNFRDICQ